MAISADSNHGVLTGTTQKEVVAAPAASTDRAVRSLHVLNRDTVPHNFTLYKKVAGTSYAIDAIAGVPAGDVWRPIAGSDIVFLSATNQSLEVVVDANATTTEPSFEASFYDRS